jgi:hypothetical protein
VIEQLDLLNEIFGGEDAAHSPRYGDMGRIHLNAKTRPLLGAVDCVSIERPHSNRAPFANVEIQCPTFPRVNERIKSRRKCAQRLLKHFHD